MEDFRFGPQNVFEKISSSNFMMSSVFLTVFLPKHLKHFIYFLVSSFQFHVQTMPFWGLFVPPTFVTLTDPTLSVHSYFQLAGGVVLAVGIWTLVEKSDYISLLSSKTYAASAYILVVAGAVVMVTGVLGCCATFKEQKRLLQVVRDHVMVHTCVYIGDINYTWVVTTGMWGFTSYLQVTTLVNVIQVYWTFKKKSSQIIMVKTINQKQKWLSIKVCLFPVWQ